MAHRLTKTRFSQGRQCHKQLWWRTHEKSVPELAIDSATQALFDRANEVGRMAREYIPGGKLINFPPWEYAESVAATRAALASGVPVIYEAAFLADNVFVAADIDVTAQVEQLLGPIPQEIAAQLAMLDGGLPTLDTGDHCSRPRRCSFWDRCWPPGTDLLSGQPSRAMA